MSYCIVVLLSCIAGHTQLHAQITESHDLLHSTRIVQHLIKKDKVKKLLLEADPEQLEILLNNFSPAEIAFEVEVLNAIVPVILYFYNPADKNHGHMQTMLEKFAHDYKNKIKVVTIDAQALYKITTLILFL